MTPYTETDPLLPIGSRLSDNNPRRNSSDAEKNSHNGKLRAQQPKHSKTSKFISRVLGISVLLSIILALTPQVIYDKISRHLQPVPQSVEQRVKRILTDTPLIGNQPTQKPIHTRF